MLRSHSQISQEQSNSTPSLAQKVAGTIPATLVQMTTLHWLDTIGKRVMKNKEKISSFEHFKKVIFLNEYNAPNIKRFTGLYAGFMNGLKYKIVQATYKFSFQPEVVKLLKHADTATHLQAFVPASLVNPFVQAIGGAIVGALEVVILPLDMAKIKQQNNPELKNKKLPYIIAQEMQKNGLKGVYKGALITIGRNVPGSAALFSFPTLTYKYIFNCDKDQASTWQQLFANGVGAEFSLLFSHIQDLIKVIKQSELEIKSSWSIINEIIEKNGYRGLTKGLGIKLLTQVPKLTAVATLSDVFTKQVQHYNPFGLFSSASSHSHAQKIQENEVHEERRMVNRS